MKKQNIKIEEKKINIWMIVGIILIVLTAFLSAMIISKMSYSAGYEDGQQGIIKIMQTSYQSSRQVMTMDSNQISKEVKAFVYFLNDMKVNSYETKS